MKIGSSQWEFMLSSVRVTEGKITVNVRRKSKANRFWFELGRGSSQGEVQVSECSSYRESTVLNFKGSRDAFSFKRREVEFKSPFTPKAWLTACLGSILGTDHQKSYRGGGEFSSCRNFFSLSNSLYEFFSGPCMNISQG